jgi:DNA-binding PadR family transcriptional regulator
MRGGGSSFLQACLLLLIGERPDHGYALLERLEPFGLADGDPPQMYRTLRALERSGCVGSRWVPSDCGPARRIYYLTAEGHATLAECAVALRRKRDQTTHYLRRHEALAQICPELAPNGRAGRSPAAIRLNEEPVR